MRWWTQTCSIHRGQSITERHSPSEPAVLLSLKEAAASTGGTTRWKEILLVKEDPNVTVSKEQRREMRLVVEVNFQHGSQEGKKKNLDERRGSEVQTVPLWREKARRQSCVVPLSSWSCLDLSRRRRHLTFQEEGMWSFLWVSSLSETWCTSSAQGCQITPQKDIMANQRTFLPFFSWFEYIEWKKPMNLSWKDDLIYDRVE